MSLRSSLPACLFVLACAATPAAADGAAEVKKVFRAKNAEEAARVLKELEGKLDAKSVEAILAEATHLRSLGVYDKLVETLATARGPALEALVKGYKRAGKQGNVRFLVLDGLGKVPEKAAEEVLAEALDKDKDEPVRVLAARLLGQRGTKSAVETLIAALTKLEKGKSERLVREVNAALLNLTGQEIALAQDWKDWWGSHKDAFSAPKHEGGGTAARGNLLDRMQKQRPGDLKTFARIKTDEIIVIKGNDKVEDVLKELELKHEVIERSAFDARKLDPQKQILILNCPGRDTFSDAGIEKVRRFVEEGGYIFCSDWELKKTLARCFPEVVEFFKETPKGPNRNVTIKPAPEGREHPLMRDVFPLNTFDEGGQAWVLEQRSHLPKPHPALVPLVSCPEIKDLGQTTVAFVFSYARDKGGRVVTGQRGAKDPQSGKVLFVSSHFKLQKDPKGDGFALQQLLLNFILEKQNQRRVAGKKKGRT